MSALEKAVKDKQLELAQRTRFQSAQDSQEFYRVCNQSYMEEYLHIFVDLFNIRAFKEASDLKSYIDFCTNFHGIKGVKAFFKIMCNNILEAEKYYDSLAYKKLVEKRDQTDRRCRMLEQDLPTKDSNQYNERKNHE